MGYYRIANLAADVDDALPSRLHAQNPMQDNYLSAYGMPEQKLPSDVNALNKSINHDAGRAAHGDLVDAKANSFAADALIGRINLQKLLADRFLAQALARASDLGMTNLVDVAKFVVHQLSMLPPEQVTANPYLQMMRQDYLRQTQPRVTHRGAAPGGDIELSTQTHGHGLHGYDVAVNVDDEGDVFPANSADSMQQSQADADAPQPLRRPGPRAYSADDLATLKRLGLA
ncbi:hypothetical protein AWB76_03290 [Caballeronia temeraria]|uniref:Uncharacterized protein n=1 Tax=Caballeronia temeraria TaxID=1777137 RepID=A0A158AY72_9BURK|nr:hypothetical protein [Caballeronia temeraria]SAK62669.1 hypothetical protein AWB76_03290 [Caballeronia temeraria]